MSTGGFFQTWRTMVESRGERQKCSNPVSHAVLWGCQGLSLALLLYSKPFPGTCCYFLSGIRAPLPVSSNQPGLSDLSVCPLCRQSGHLVPWEKLNSSTFVNTKSKCHLHFFRNFFFFLTKEYHRKSSHLGPSKQFHSFSKWSQPWQVQLLLHLLSNEYRRLTANWHLTYLWLIIRMISGFFFFFPKLFLEFWTHWTLSTVYCLSRPKSLSSGQSRKVKTTQCFVNLITILSYTISL